MSIITIVISIENEAGLKSPVCQRYGKSPYYLIARTNDDDTVDIIVKPNRRFGGHQMGLLHTKHSCGATVLLAGRMEPRIRGMFKDIGVDVVCDIEGTAEEVLHQYLSTKDTAFCDSGYSQGEGFYSA